MAEKHVRYRSFYRSVIEVCLKDGTYLETLPELFKDSHEALAFDRKHGVMAKMTEKYGPEVVTHYAGINYTPEEAQKLGIKSRILLDWEFARSLRERGWGSEKIGKTIFVVE